MCMWMGPLHTPTAGTSGACRFRASVIRPAGLVKLTSSAGRQLAQVGGDHSTTGSSAGLGEPADARGLLADEAVAPAEVLVLAPGLHPADAELRDDVAGPPDRIAAVGREHHVERVALGVHHALRERADDREAVQVRVHQPQLADRQRRTPPEEPAHQLGGVGRAATDDRDLHRPGRHCWSRGHRSRTTGGRSGGSAAGSAASSRPPGAAGRAGPSRPPGRPARSAR